MINFGHIFEDGFIYLSPHTHSLPCWQSDSLPNISDSHIMINDQIYFQYMLLYVSSSNIGGIYVTQV